MNAADPAADLLKVKLREDQGKRDLLLGRVGVGVDVLEQLVGGAAGLLEEGENLLDVAGPDRLADLADAAVLLEEVD